MRILVTGGAGYIGSHICVAALEAGHDLTVFDNFCNSDPATLIDVGRITRTRFATIEGDVRSGTDLVAALRESRPDVVIHLAGLKAVGESVAKPLDYFETNVHGTACLLDAMKQTGVRHLVFSSSATVYGEPMELPLKETHRLKPVNPYGRSKLTAEWLCRDFQHAEPDFRVAILRYFNPVGAHDSGRIGDNPKGVPNNLMPFLVKVASGERDQLEIFGADYPTPDGTGVRDYLHVCDLAEGHLAAIERLGSRGMSIANLGTGIGYSVLDLVHAFERATGVSLPVRYGPRRSGDLAEYYACPDEAHRLLGWRARRNLEDMCFTAWQAYRGIQDDCETTSQVHYRQNAVIRIPSGA